ncbi:MAG: hypothetical protein FJX03_00660 [Alphaproteobacteria bacterium]|nr:hypothetical protein [Alphaproteobacteria bacterium]
MLYEKYLNLLSHNHLVIFLFHGVVKDNSFAVRNYNRKHLLDSEFDTLLKELKAKGNALSMDEVVHCMQEERSLPPKSFAITFDDGFENNYSIAAPILSDLRIPSSFYIATDFIDNNRMSWADQIDYCIENTSVEEIHVSLFDTLQCLSSKGDKINFLNKVRGVFKKDRDIFKSRESYIHEIFSACEVDYTDSQDGSLDQKLSWSQVKLLSADSNFIIGGHTHTHPIMSFLSNQEIDFEIDVSLRKIENTLGKPTRHFSYPEGLEHCYNKDIIEKLKERGIICSPSAMDGINTMNDDLFNLKRVSVV